MPNVPNTASGSYLVTWNAIVMVGRIRTTTNLPLPGIMDTTVHHERRKPWSRAFSAAALKEYEPRVSNRANQLIEVLERQKGEVSLGVYINYFACVHLLCLIPVELTCAYTCRYDFMCDMAYVSIRSRARRCLPWLPKLWRRI